ncbi:hypothetical protein LLE49_11740 [Alicyclobacillus tolerans]|nr:hypothetical protein [Alicyclobacillus tolerans]MCF8565390.1 hypothetical protein [Alicyclobacillus tolerans]
MGKWKWASGSGQVEVGKWKWASGQQASWGWLLAHLGFSFGFAIVALDLL